MFGMLQHDGNVPMLWEQFGFMSVLLITLSLNDIDGPAVVEIVGIWVRTVGARVAIQPCSCHAVHF